MGWALIRGWALINFFCLWDGRLFEVGANSTWGAYSNKYDLLGGECEFSIWDHFIRDQQTFLFSDTDDAKFTFPIKFPNVKSNFSNP